MREDDFYASALLGGMEMLKTGTTTVLDHFFGNQACPFMGAGAAIQAMRDLGLRHVVALTLSDRNYEETIPLGSAAAAVDDEIRRMSQSEAKATQAWLDDCEAFIETFHAPDRLTTACPGPSAVQRCTKKKLADAYSSSGDQGTAADGTTTLRHVSVATFRIFTGAGLQRFVGSFDLDR
jgi:cytosine/adenosine deaminase-related metal-dependent hydrolase